MVKDVSAGRGISRNVLKFIAIFGVALVSFFYKGKNGTKNKFLQYFFYVFYPLHLVLIHVVNLIAG